MNQMLALPKDIDQLSPQQKTVAMGMTVTVVGFVGYFLAPYLIIAFTNLIILGALAALVAIVIYNYQLFWNIFKTISWKCTQKWIGLDTIAAAERYYEWTGTQLQEANSTYIEMKSNLNDLLNKISAREKSYNDNKSKASLALEKKNTVQAEIFGSKALDDEGYLKDLIPMSESAKEGTEQMEKIVEIFDTKRQSLRYKIDTLTDKRTTLMRQYKGMKAFQKFLDNDDINARMYVEAEKQIFNEISNFTASIETYQQKIKPVLEEAEFDKEVRKTKVSNFLDSLKANN